MIIIETEEEESKVLLKITVEIIIQILQVFLTFYVIFSVMLWSCCNMYGGSEMSKTTFH